VELPGYIVEKWEKGRIPAAMFSDLLRVELLIKYGGTWIDSTVFCTGVNDEQGSLREKSKENLTENLSNSQLDTDSKLSTEAFHECAIVCVSIYEGGECAGEYIELVYHGVSEQ